MGLYLGGGGGGSNKCEISQKILENSVNNIHLEKKKDLYDQIETGHGPAAGRFLLCFL